MRRTSEEFSAEILTQRVYVKYLDHASIQRDAEQLMEDVGIEPTLDAVPIPVEEILEDHLKFHLEFDDLLSACNAWGATLPKSQTVVVDESLDPTQHPHSLGRYRFTISHEIGHIRLHNRYLVGLAEPAQDGAPQGETGPTMLDSQADVFASLLLMPERAIRQAWDQQDDALPDPPPEWIQRTSLPSRVSALATHFQVSRLAMKLRLTNLGLVDDAATLFAPVSQGGDDIAAAGRRTSVRRWRGGNTRADRGETVPNGLIHCSKILQGMRKAIYG